MKRTLWTLAAVAGAAIWTTGCNNGTPGGPGTDKDKDKDKGSVLQRAEDAVVQPEDLRAELVRDVIGQEVGDDHLRAVRSEAACDRRADPRRRAGDDGGLPLELHRARL